MWHIIIIFSEWLVNSFLTFCILHALVYYFIQEGVKYQAWRTTPFDVACTISRGLADNSQVARVTYSSYVSDYNSSEDGMDGVDIEDGMADLEISDESKEDGSGGKSNMTFLWDMTRPLVGNVSKMEFLKFEDDPDARTAFWHSSAHILGEALEHLYGSRLTIGPPLAGGFYYDSYMGDGSGDGALREEDCKCVVELLYMIFRWYIFVHHTIVSIFLVMDACNHFSSVDMYHAIIWYT